MTISIGLAMADFHDQTSDISRLAEQLIARADDAVYQAKHRGRNQVVSDGLTPSCTAQPAWNQPSTWLNKLPQSLKKWLPTGFNKLIPTR